MNRDEPLVIRVTGLSEQLLELQTTSLLPEKLLASSYLTTLTKHFPNAQNSEGN